MDSASLFPDFFMQCCDAGYFLDLGSQCATKNICYGTVRPSGAYYWFSWPTRLGLSNNALIHAHLFLLALSSFLAVLSLLPLCKFIKRSFSAPITYLFITFLIIVCSTIHLVFFWPTLFTSLSDAPAALFLLNGTWLLLLSCHSSGKKQILLLVVGSLCLGMAAWIRAFYLYPLLLGIFSGIAAIVFNAKRNLSKTLLLCALIFPAIQFVYTYKESGKLAYLNSGESNAWTKIHLASDAIGYDTVFQNQGYYSLPQYCNIRSGLLTSLQDHDYSSAFCLFANRASFYLATYRAETFIYPNFKNKLFMEEIQDIGNEKSWLRHNLDWQPDVAKDPYGGMTADKMSVQSAHPSYGTYTSQWAALPGNTSYTFSVWLWSDQQNSIEISFRRHSDNAVMASTTAVLGQTPERFSITGKTVGFDEYSVMIGTPSSTANVLFGSSLPAVLYAWGAQLEEGETMTGYAGPEPWVASDIRSWHPWLLAANSLAIVFTLLFIIRARKTLLSEPAGLAITVIAGAVFAEALAIIPEQRFCVAFMVIIWVFSLGYVLTLLPGTRTSHSLVSS